MTTNSSSSSTLYSNTSASEMSTAGLPPTVGSLASLSPIDRDTY